MNNYPTGAAHDPEAPYNKEPQERMNVTVKACMFKDVDIPVPPDMRSTFVNVGDLQVEVPDERLYDCFLQENRTPVAALDLCVKVLQALIKEKRTSVDNVYLPRLLDDCKNWQLDHYTVES
jgi:hypothetical protein